MKLAVSVIAAFVCATSFAEAPSAPCDASQKTNQAMTRIDGLLSASKAFFLATVDGDQPKLRPLGAHHVVDGKVWLGVGEFKNVYRQLAANPKCELVALQPEGGKWLRWTGRAAFADGEQRERLEEIFLNAMPGLRKIYDKTPGKRMMCFTLADSRAELIPTMPPGEVILDESKSVGKACGAKLAERNRESMRLFEKCINTNDIELSRKLISPTAAFKTPVSPEPLMGAEGYLSVVTMMRKSFPDVQWKLEDMVADANTVAVQWTCSGTFTGTQPFAGVQPNGRRFSTTVMNFYKFDENGLIVDDIAGVGVAGILKGIGAQK